MDTAAPSPAPAAAAPEAVSGSDLAASLIGEAAAVPAKVETPPAAAAPATPPAPAGEPARDSLGRAFDPKKFRQRPDGSPFTNSRGHFMPRGGRKPGRATPPAASGPAPRVVHLPPVPDAPKPAEPAGTTATPPPPPTGSAAPKPETVAPSKTAMEQTAEAYLRAAYVAADAIMDGKGEWNPDDPAEHAGLKEPLVEHLIISGGQPLPSWARVLVAAIAYAAKRFNRPNTRKTADYYWRRFTGAKPVQPAAPPRTATAPQPAPAPTEEKSAIEILPLR